MYVNGQRIRAGGDAESQIEVPRRQSIGRT